MDPATIAMLISQLLPFVLSTLAPLITALVERLTKATGNKLPDPTKPVINVGAGAGLATLVGGNPLAGVVGAMVGNRVREALNNKKKR